ncbi:MAG: nucleotidyltransferase, partial [Lentisphaerae bacterium]|nr:nucleotidyltransferase [Lentisphaerota bacterium]
MQPTLVVMAAGVGSRYGGLKQIDPIGPSGEIMLDYSVYDAIRAGFGKVVFIIRHDIETDFKKVIGDHLADRIAVEYVFQELGACLPTGETVPAERQKPWGTGHAILCCRDTVREPFAVINADDFYGPASYQTISTYLAARQTGETSFAMVGFRLFNTLSDHGHVTRGICEVDRNDMLVSVRERFKIEKNGTQAARYEDEQGRWLDLHGDEIASMNMFGLTPAVFAELERKFPAFLAGARGQPKAEFLMPS